MKKSGFFVFIFLACHLFSVGQNNASTITIVFTDIRSSKGNLQFGVYKTEAEFKDEKPVKMVRVPKTENKNGMYSCVLHLPPGSYGVSVLDDENSNGLMDYNMLGMPKEGFAFSNYYHSGFSRPTLSLFKFDVKEDRMSVVCKFRYL